MLGPAKAKALVAAPTPKQPAEAGDSQERESGLGEPGFPTEVGSWSQMELDPGVVLLEKTRGVDPMLSYSKWTAVEPTASQDVLRASNKI